MLQESELVHGQWQDFNLVVITIVVCFNEIEKSLVNKLILKEIRILRRGFDKTKKDILRKYYIIGIVREATLKSRQWKNNVDSSGMQDANDISIKLVDKLMLKDWKKVILKISLVEFALYDLCK